MAKRPAWSVVNGLVVKRDYEFIWNPGFAVSQKKKNIINLHAAIKEQDGGKALEISSKSDLELGNKLSAFHLKLNDIFLENQFQAAKQYEQAGPFIDLLSVHPKDAKRDERHKTSGKLIAFLFEGEKWELIPKTAFYDYLYLRAVFESVSREELKKLFDFDWFTDIEFNPQKSINCQARSAAILKLLISEKQEDVLKDQKTFLAFHIKSVKEGN